ncbi:type VI secretion system contractile sheath small subunit, partial [Pseudomonas viridiflava]|uniref:type VI secretion system contractile sheath small subunit n=1 Tax=Pseudomonas viridiflava TaxID=33069 RepID=UPI000F01E4A9
NEVPEARVNIKLDLHTGGAQKKVELPLKIMLMGDYSNGREQRPLSERGKVDINKNNFDSVLGEFSPSLRFAVNNTLSEDASDTTVELSFQSMKDFEPEQVARQVPQLRALLATRNLLRDLKSNLLDNVVFRQELERILKDDALSDELRAELAALAPEEQR